MDRYLEAVTYKKIPDKSLFLAGGITGCWNWQAEIKPHLLTIPGLWIVNPRRESFDVSNPKETDIQIEWEHHYLDACPNILFWFPEETLCPITLFELGKMAMNPNKTLFVGCHPWYEREKDVVKQLSLIRPEIKVSFDLESLVNDIKKHFKNSVEDK